MNFFGWQRLLKGRIPYNVVSKSMIDFDIGDMEEKEPQHQRTLSSPAYGVAFPK
tara:strand:+ start:497 stop:658 length:162 start_codon:yes stop_codon:yes gene_type:complete